MGASENAIEGVSAARKVHGILCAAAVFRPMLHRPWLFLLALLPIAGCTTLGDTFDVTPFLREQITGDTSRACLAREYQMQTRYVLRADRNWGEASRFSAKGWAALRGEDVRHWAAVEFRMERTRVGGEQVTLDSVLSSNPNRDRDACSCAKAEAAYDGWLAAAARGVGDLAMLEKNFGEAVAACRSRKPDDGVEAR